MESLQFYWQSKNDDGMLLKTQNYDFMNYLKRWKISCYQMDDKFIILVLTFVIHWGKQNRWHCENHFDFNRNTIFVKHRFNDYIMNFYDVKDTDIIGLEMKI